MDTNYRAVSDDWAVFALAHLLGDVTSTPQSVVFSIGQVRDPVIEYIQQDDTFEGRSYYFWSAYSTIAEVVCITFVSTALKSYYIAQISDFLSDYSAALSRANSLDETLQTASASISSAYADIVALSMRQTFGATELTISGSPGAWNTSDTLMFLKGA